MPDNVMNESTSRPSIKNLAAALCKAQSEMEGAKKAANNPHFNRKYADLASVWEAIREPLTKNGLSVVQLLHSVQGGVEVETVLMHTSGESIGGTFAIPANKNDAQGFGSAATYARRYSLMALVGVAPEEDDGNAASQGAPGSAGAGGEFRPAGRRVPLPNPRAALAEAAREIENGTAGGGHPPKPAPAPAANGNAVKRAQWVKDSIAAIGQMQTKDELGAWWKENTERIEIVETSLPTEHERLIVAYDARMDAVAARAA
jgi:hypothetical protein